MRRWLEENPDDEFAQEAGTELSGARKRLLTSTGEFLCFGVFALIARNGVAGGIAYKRYSFILNYETNYRV